MLDIALLRRDPDRVRRSAQRRGQDPSFVDRVLELDARKRQTLTAVEALKAEKNALTGAIKNAADRAAEAVRLKPRIAELDARIARDSEALPGFDDEMNKLISDVPNVLDDSVPDGKGEEDNRTVRTWGTPRTFDFTPKAHWEIGESLGIIDFERAAKLSGSRFAVLRGAGARLSRAIVSFFLDRAGKRGYFELAVPYLVTRETMWSTGQLSKFADAMFADGDYFMIPTAEVPLTAYHKNEILANDTLPARYTAYSACFRKEAGAAGKDTRGLIRQHQFEKVELVWIARPEESFANLETLIGDAAALLEELELPFRQLLLCSADVSFNAAKTYDLEVWVPSSSSYREISSCSNCTDFQARRSEIRFRREATAKPEFVHSLNGSGLAVGRTLLALLENGQQVDGSVTLPAALVPFAGFSRIAMDGSTV